MFFYVKRNIYFNVKNGFCKTLFLVGGFEAVSARPDHCKAMGWKIEGEDSGLV